VAAKNTYKETFKATSLFGGLQVFNILISICRGKVTAIFLGPGGYGIIGLLESGLGIVGLVTGLGVGFSGVKDIAEANDEGNRERISKTAETIRRWSWWTGLLGVVTVISFSPLLGKWLAGNIESNESLGKSGYTWMFVLLSVTLLFVAISNGQQALLRGLRKLKDIVKIGFYGSIAGLVVTISLYYFCGIVGIVPALVLNSGISLLISWHYVKKVDFAPIRITYKESFLQGQGLIKLGSSIMLSNMIMRAVSYLIILYILDQTGEEAVGLYNAGWAMTNQCVGLVFTAMSVDYFPRLVSMRNNREGMNEAVNQQAEIAVLIIAPIMIVYLALLPLLLKLLLREDFMPITGFVQWTILGMLFKTASWALGSIISAKGDYKLFLLSEFLSSAIYLILNVVGYYFYGLEGVGIAFVISTLLYFIAMLIFAKKRYSVSFNKEFTKLFLFQFVLSTACFFMVYIKGYPFAYIPCLVLFVVSAAYSFHQLNTKTGLLEMFISRIKKK
jgi:O-antigen/teichoic acid export membrane protein